jgi:hypothetical protein
MADPAGVSDHSSIHLERFDSIFAAWTAFGQPTVGTAQHVLDGNCTAGSVRVGIGHRHGSLNVGFSEVIQSKKRRMIRTTTRDRRWKA